MKIGSRYVPGIALVVALGSSLCAAAPAGTPVKTKFNFCFITLNSNDERIEFYNRLKADKSIGMYELTWKSPLLSDANVNCSQLQVSEKKCGAVAIDPAYQKNIESKIPVNGCHALVISGHHVQFRNEIYGEGREGSFAPPPVPALSLSDLALSAQACNVSTYPGMSGVSHPKLLGNLLETWLFACNTMRDEIILSKVTPQNRGGIAVKDIDRTRIVFGTSYSIGGYNCKAKTGSLFKKELSRYLDGLQIKHARTNPSSPQLFYSEHLRVLQQKKDGIISGFPIYPMACSSNPTAESCLIGGTCDIRMITGAKLGGIPVGVTQTYCDTIRQITQSGKDSWFDSENQTTSLNMPVRSVDVWGRFDPCSWSDNRAETKKRQALAQSRGTISNYCQ